MTVTEPDAIASRDITPVELALATRNSGMPLEALSADITPTGLHYLLIHYDIPTVDAQTWTLSVGGHVESPLRLTLDELRRRPATTMTVTLECAGNGRALQEPRPVSQPWLYEAVGTAEWTGTPLAPLLEEAGVRPETAEYVFTGLDRGVEGGTEQQYERSLSTDVALSGDVLVAYEMNGAPLLAQHGAPVRLIVPGWYGMASVKWLSAITAVTQPFEGYQQARAYRWRESRDEPGTPLSTIAVRSLMVPPGIPEFPSRVRHVPTGDCTIVGRAWSAAGGVTDVAISDDGGQTWQEATVDAPAGPYGWQRWSVPWRPRGPGAYELWCRATDSAGNAQPIEPRWNLGGYAVNAVQRVEIVVDA